ncbi:UpxY family transcription antiterminator [Saccharicrinis sp. FJH62]|uniref:UpxY family transcription antiterminator n=1 Tax=Saccharicrinis sp. FJH62 TaxID=3344657 RepID=UPI0035D48D45
MTEEAKLRKDMNGKNNKYAWYAIYTRSRAEKKAFEYLNEDGIEAYLPLKKTLRQWSDRKKMVEMPLVPSYIFVYVSEKEYYKALNTPYTIRYVTFNGKAAPIPEREINLLKLMLRELPNDVNLIVTDIEKGDMVEITAGPLKGAKGEVVYKKGKQHFQVRLEPLGYAVQAEVAGAFLQKLKA